MDYLRLIKIKITFTMWLILFFCLCFFIFTNPVFAIPSPELIIGSASSISQLFAVGFAVVSGAVATFGAKFGFMRKKTNAPSKALVNSVIVLAVLLAASVGYILFQKDQSSREEQVRLQQTLVRPAAFKGTKILDDSLKETSFSAQSKSDLSITTAEAHDLLVASDGSKETLFLDVRERAENMMGTLPGAQHIRFPDIVKTDLNLADKKLVLLCHNGNRSSETCERLAAMGIDCSFIAGGIEKWIVEGRSFTDSSVRGLSDLRAIPDYKNKDTLISTSQFNDITANTDIQIIDTRYPKDFAANHLPNAINIPLRALPTPELEQRLSKLEKKPTIVACYDRRSCFMGQVLGLEIAERGIDFLGRYTTPWDYFVKPTPKPHVQEWLLSQNQTLWGKTTETLAGFLLEIANKSHFIVSIILLSLASRIIVLPIALKSEKDRIALAANKAELAAIKNQLKNDPIRRARAVQDLHNGLGLTPLRNLAALLFLPVMMLGLSAVELASKSVETGFLWLTSLGAADPTYLFPILFCLLAGSYLQMTMATTRIRRAIAWGLVVPLLIIMVFQLTGAGAIYLSISLILLLIQRAYVTGGMAKRAGDLRQIWQGWKVKYIHRGVIPLQYSNLLKRSGNKSYRLAVLTEAGFNVPQGIIVGSDVIAKYPNMDAIKKAKFFDHLWHMMGEKTCVVRSSGSDEDGAGQSYAGVFESVLDVDRDELPKAFEQVLNSFSSSRAGAYQGGDTTHCANVLIQAMVNAEYSGVLFTQDPMAPGQMLVELAKGTADDLVSGRVTPLSLRFGKFTLQKCDENIPPIELSRLLEIARKVEALFGCPQDVEWTYKDGEFSLVQSRDITTLNIGSNKELSRQKEWLKFFNRFGKSTQDGAVLKQDEMSEVLPRPTPFSFSVMSSLWRAGGSVDLASRALGMDYKVPESGDGHLFQLFDKVYADVTLKSDTALQLPKSLRKDLENRCGQIESHFYHAFLPALHQKLEYWNALDFSKLHFKSQLDLVEEVTDYFVNEVYAFAEQINIMASILHQHAASECERQNVDMLKLMQALMPHAPSQIIARAAELPNEQRKKTLLQEMGHRAVFDYELSLPRYAENPEMLWKLGQSNVRPVNFERDAPVGNGRDTRSPLVQRAVQFQDLKEYAKHESIRVLSVLRKILCEIDANLGAQGFVFYLTYKEVLECDESNLKCFIDLASNRFETSQSFKNLAPNQAALSLHDCEILSCPMQKKDLQQGALQGVYVAGNQDVTGHIYRATEDHERGDADLKGFTSGDILVCNMINPAWLPYILKSKAVICEVGGWLSHMAIVAREHNIPMIVGCTGLECLEHGEQVKVLKTGGIERLTEARGNVALNIQAR